MDAKGPEVRANQAEISGKRACESISWGLELETLELGAGGQEVKPPAKVIGNFWNSRGSGAGIFPSSGVNWSP